MNKFIVFSLAFVAACALAAQAGPISQDELVAARRTREDSLNFFANLIQKNQEDTQKQLTNKDAFKTTRDQFQKSIDANKGAPIPKPMNKEVNVYLHDEADEDVPEDDGADVENEAPEEHVEASHE